MFHYISGKVAEITPALVVIDTGGVGYAINTSLTSAGKVKIGDSATFHTYLNVREDVFELYGFSSREELTCFRQLIAISGVGPKAAAAILGAVTPDKLVLSILTGDEKALCAAPGIGKKLAQRIILELKDKISKTAAASGDFGIPAPEAAAAPGGAFEDAIAALGVLGYSRADALRALGGADPALGTEQLVRLALSRLF